MRDGVTERICPVCGSGQLHHDAPYLDPYWEATAFFRTLSISWCRACGFGYSVPDLDDPTIDGFYVDVYRNIGSPFYIDFQSLERPIGYDYRALAQLVLAKHFTEFHRGDYFVDVGPGSGGSFAMAMKVLQDPCLAAVEIHRDARAAYRRLYSANAVPRVKDLIGQGVRAKICLLSHLLEHYKQSWLPAALGELKLLTAPGGIIVVEVPHVDMRQHASRRSGDSPHFLFFSRDSLAKLFHSHNFEMLFLETCAEPYSCWRGAAPQASMCIRTRWAAHVKAAAKSLMARLPSGVKSYVRDRLVPGRTMDFGDVQFAYGGDRTCLRAVVRPL